LAAVVLGLAHPSRAHASAAGERALESRAEAHSRFFADVAVFAAVADADFRESGRDVAELNGFGCELALRLGGFTGSHVLLTAEVDLSYLRTDAPEVHDSEYFTRTRAVASQYFNWTLGPQLTIYPSTDAGLFFGLGVGLGLMSLPAFTEGGVPLSARYLVEGGYQFIAAGGQPIEAVIRYAAAGADELMSSEHPDSLTSQQLELGVRLAL